MSTANNVALAVTARLQTITVANGYDTDIGLKATRGRKRPEAAHLPCAVIIERPDNPAKQSLQREPQVKIKQKYVLEGHAACDPDNPNDVGHKIISDIKKAVWKDKLTFGTDQKVFAVMYEGCVISPREDGIAVVSAAVEISVEFVETLSAP